MVQVWCLARRLEWAWGSKYVRPIWRTSTALLTASTWRHQERQSWKTWTTTENRECSFQSIQVLSGQISTASRTARCNWTRWLPKFERTLCGPVAVLHWSSEMHRCQLDLLQSLGQLLESTSFPQVDGELRNYGNDALGVGAEHYTPVLNPDTQREEFMQFKFTLRAHGSMNFAHTCKAAMTDYKEVFPEFAKLANAALAIPVSSVPCEGGFRRQNRIKKADRSRLTDEHVDNLMLIVNGRAFDSR